MALILQLYVFSHLILKKISSQNDICPCEKSELSEALFTWMHLGNMPIKAYQPLYDIYLPVQLQWPHPEWKKYLIFS